MTAIEKQDAKDLKDAKEIALITLTQCRTHVAGKIVGEADGFVTLEGGGKYRVASIAERLPISEANSGRVTAWLAELAR